LTVAGEQGVKMQSPLQAQFDGVSGTNGSLRGVQALRDALADVLQSKDASFFLCVGDATQSRITLHTTRRNVVKAMCKAAQSALADAGLSCAIDVIAHDRSTLDRPRSLEQLLAAFPHEVLIHDPTAVFGRARALVMAAAQAREEFGAAIGGIYLNPAARLVFVVAPGAALESNIGRSLEAAIEASAVALGSVQINRPPVRVRVVDQLPQLELVAIDDQSVRANAGTSKAKRWMLALAASIGLAAAPAAAMADHGDTRFQTAAAALPGLSVFSDDAGVSAFASHGLGYYFGMSVEVSGSRQLAQVQMPQVTVFGLTIWNNRTGVPGQDPDQGGFNGGVSS
jgi:hypothetical protein